jgi:hypothetical protein
MNAHQKVEKATAEKRTPIDKDLEEELRARLYRSLAACDAKEKAGE